MIKIYGIYAHRNKINNIVFYVGKQQKNKSGYIRSETFYSGRSDKYKEYVELIGVDNIEIIWLYKTLDENEPLNEKEKIFQEAYYRIYGDDFMCNEFVAYKERNPNFGNSWSDEQREALSRVRKKNGKSKGKNNPMAKKCLLHFPNGETKKFNTLSGTREWFWKNITDGEKIGLCKNEFSLKNVKCMKKDRRQPYEKSIGFYYTEA